MIRAKRIIIICFLILCAFTTKGQSEKLEKVVIMSHVEKEGQVQLRWAPGDPIFWKYSNKYGYVIERYLVSVNGKLQKETKKVILTKTALKPLPLEQWREPSENNKYAAIAAEALYGDTFEVDSKSTDIMSMVNMARELENRYSFALFSADKSFNVAQMMGLALKDSLLNNAAGYLYRVYANTPPSVAKSDTASVYVEAGKITPLPKIVMAKGTFQQKEVELTWPQKMYKGIYTSYVIEKAINSASEFTPINDLPFTSVSKSASREPENAYYMDTIPQIGIPYYYRIKGVNPFGFSGPYSDTICVETYTKFTTKPTITSATVVDNKQVIVKWDFPVEYNMLSKGFRVMVSTSIRSNYKQINTELIKPHIREFTITNPNRVNYIVVEAIDGGNNNYSSMPQMALLKDLVPPAEPVGLLGTVDSLGNVKLKWTPNTDNDLLGYRVYFANSPNDEYSQITKEALTNATFNYKVPLNTLNNFIYFKVQAIDQSFNRSLMSDYSKVVKPDTIPPTTPVIVVAEYVNGAVYIKWHKSYSNDIKAEYLLRYNNSLKPDTILRVFGGSQEYSDANITDGQKYRYTVVAKDNSNNFSRNPIVVAVKIPKKDISIKNPFTAVADRVQNQILLEWRYSKTNSVYIYRAEAEGKYRMIKTITGSENSFADKNVKLNTTYKYRLRATLTNGTNTKMSDEVVVKF